MSRSCFIIALAFCSSALPAIAAVPSYNTPTIYGRTGFTSFNLPDGSSLASPTISLNNHRDVALDVNFVGDTGNPGLFYAEYTGGTPLGGIVFNAADTISGNPMLSNGGQAAFTVGFEGAPFVYDRVTNSTDAVNYPLGITGSSNLTITDTQLLGGRLAIGFSGDVYGTFAVQTAGLPALTMYAADNGIDVSSNYSFLYTPATSQTGGIGNAPRIAAKVSTTAGFDFEEIRLFEADGTSTLVADETELNPQSAFSEFITNSVSVSDNGTQVAFQATDTLGISGIYRYDSLIDQIDLIASITDTFVSTIDIFAPDVNDEGLVTFRGDDDAGRSSVFVGDGQSLVRVAGEGDLIQTDLGQRQLGRRDMDFSQAGALRLNNQGDVGFLFQYFDPANAASVADGSLILVATASTTSGDFDDNGLYECADIDALVIQIAAGTNEAAFDLTGDGFVNIADRDAWLAEAGAAQLTSGNAYLLGDANLDGTVDGQDFVIWNANKFTAQPGWCAGDFSADGFVDGQDFVLWNSNKFTTADASMTMVPEPKSLAILIACTLFVPLASWKKSVRRERTDEGCCPASHLAPDKQLCNQRFNDLRRFNTRQFLIQSLELVRQPIVIETQQLQHGGVEVANVDRVSDDVVGEIVGLTVDRATLGTAAGHPHREAARVMVAAVVVFGEPALRVDRAAELAAPDDQRVVQHASLLEIFQQGVTRLIDVLALTGHTTGDIGVVVPVVVVDLNEAHAAFGQSTGHQRGVGKRARLLGLLRRTS